MTKVYAAMAQTGTCQVCGKEADLRYGACFSCCDQVDGEYLGGGQHKLWDSKNPSNVWFVSESVQ